MGPQSHQQPKVVDVWFILFYFIKELSLHKNMNFVKPIKISCVLPSISQPLKNKFIQACYFGGFHVIIHNYLVIQKIGRYPSTI